MIGAVKFLRPCLLACTLTGALFSASSQVPTIDFANVNAADLHALPWEFYWKKFIKPSAFRQESFAPDAITPAIIWKNIKGTQAENQSFGYATYRLRFKIRGAQEYLGIRMPYPYSEYKIFVNNVLVASAGKTGISAESSVAARRSVTIFFPAQPEINEIIIHVSNFKLYRGGIRGKILLSPADTMQQREYIFLAIDLFSMGLIFAIMLYHFLIYLMTQKDASTFLFASLALVYFFLALTFGEQVISLFFSELPLEFMIRSGAFFFYVLPVLLLAFTYKLFPGTFPRYVLAIYIALAFGATMLLWLPPEYFTRYNIYYYSLTGISSVVISFAASVRALQKKLSGSLLMTLGLASLFCMGIYAFFLFTNFEIAGSYLSVGFAIFALFQSGALAHNHAALERKHQEVQLRLDQSRKALQDQRKQIEANLHDSLGGNLTDISFAVENAQRASNFSRVKALLRLISKRVKASEKSLRTQLLFLEDLELAMRELFNGINLILLRRYQMAKKPVDIFIDERLREIDLQISDPVLTSDADKIEICMLIQEMCNNNLKYGKKTAYWKIYPEGAQIIFEVTSQTSHIKKQSGTGSKTLKERTEKLNGQYTETTSRKNIQCRLALNFVNAKRILAR